ncbi:hypothetical protein [Rhizobium lentis]|uniref:Uncharacterized protein n=1 Tax=Rhizobium lentis TaxID=1138194 RepID=A0A7W8UQB6_9HYPH|nr:hypothetical protein [Rhizobium lentis]MBB5551134.1 hypothetical protein [Rhizobium lentis]MBB5561669.1 hypothetical protein [Rhizobium lentis]MBB5568254.1 hypothetical protein [Rhizobium lentis]
MTLIDTNVLLDLVTDDQEWADWSIAQLEAASTEGHLVPGPFPWLPYLFSCRWFAAPADIGGLTVTLPDAASENGKAERVSIFEPDNGSDGLLVINGSNTLKVDRL